MIIDTNAVSEFFDGTAAVVEKVSAADALYLPVIVLGEYRFGLLGSRKRAEREPLLLEFAQKCSALPILESTAGHYAAIRHELRKAGTPIPENDIWIAALSREHNLPILSDDRHFDHVHQIRRMNW